MTIQVCMSQPWSTTWALKIFRGIFFRLKPITMGHRAGCINANNNLGNKAKTIFLIGQDSISNEARVIQIFDFLKV